MISRVFYQLLTVAVAAAWVHPSCTSLGRRESLRLRSTEQGKDAPKGFGKTPPPPKKKKNQGQGEILLGGVSNEASGVDTGDDALISGAAGRAKVMPPASPGARAALEEMKANEAKGQLVLDSKIAQLDEVQETLNENPTAGVIPDKVAKRMLFRMLPLAMTPIVGGVSLFVYFYLSATKGDVEFQPTVVAYATTVPWLLGLAGLTFGILSSSWDEDVEVRGCR
mmetsp:Transcript_19159/g.39453  ORF Transcript_19159/g.39453 Transcript_19159/m.39453 type:complete len:224 (+) Transcript_19159:71-742(+)